MATAITPLLSSTVNAVPSVATPALDKTQDRPDYVSIYVSSILAVTLVFLIGVGWPSSIFLDDYTSGFGLGAMCALWGGPSFGVMAGSARVSAWFEASEVDH